MALHKSEFIYCQMVARPERALTSFGFRAN